MQIDDAKMKDFVTQAILETMTPEKRQEILTDAVKALLEPREERAGFGHTKTVVPIHQAFQGAVEHVARDLILAHLRESDEFKEQLVDLFTEAWSRVMTDPEKRERVVERMAEGMGKIVGRLRDEESY